MFSKVEGRKKMGEESRKGKLLSDIESLSKALNLDKLQSKSSIPTVNNRFKSLGTTQLVDSKSKVKDSDEDGLGKKKSIWSWKGLKSLTHVRNKRFNCGFSVQVHSVQGLPLGCDGLSLRVHWKRRDGELTTRPARVFEGIAEFEEQLTHTCSVYGSRSGPHHSAKYEAKYFLLYVSVFGNPQLDLGKHRVDLSRLLPLTLEELEDEKSSGRWTTSFRLSGTAKGATLNVSFAYLVIGNNSTGPSTNSDLTTKVLNFRQNSYQSDDRSTVRRVLPDRLHASSRSVENIKDLHEVLPISCSALSDSVNILYQKFDEEKQTISVDKPELDVISEPLESVTSNSQYDAAKDNVESQFEVSEVLFEEHGIELSSEEQVKPEDDNLKLADDSMKESLDIPKTDSSDGVVLEEDTKFQPLVQEFDSQVDNLVVSECNFEGDSLMKELESALSSVSDLVKEGSHSQEEDSQISSQEKYLEVESNLKVSRKGKSLSLDDVTETVASDFLQMLGIEHGPFGLSSESEPESPRERLLRQFEKDALAHGSSLFNFDGDGDLSESGGDTPSGSGWGAISEDFNHLSVAKAYEEMPKLETGPVRSKTRASILEDLETEALMREWGLNEKAFQSSPPNSSDGFGSPIDLPLEQPIPLPPLGEGLGPFVQTKNGGFLRSMSPELFRNAKVGGSLVMQVSSPVVIPAEMGSGIMEILQGLASVGIEKLSRQASKLMPLEDISGKTMQQISWEADHSLEDPERQVLPQHEYDIGHYTSDAEKQVKGKPSGPRSSKRGLNSIGNELESECVSLEDLAPLAMDNLEALSIEGLRIQSDMSKEDAPSNISPESTSEVPALKGKMVNIGGSLGLEGAGGLQLLDIKDSGDDDGGLMGLSLTLDDWMRLDSGIIDDEDEISERTSKILAAHHANSGDWFRGKSNGERKRGKGSRKYGMLGNNFTVALMVQLRDPLRNYEPVGTPMLALIQVERLFVPPKPKIYSTVSEIRLTIEDEEDETETAKKEAKEEKLHEEEVIPVFKITEVHVAGLKTEPGKKKLWGSKTQQQSGSRWLLANGMGKSNKHPLMKSKVAAKSSSLATTKVQPGETLWSISSRVHGTGSKWKDLAALNPHIRNPNVILPNETIRLR